jgi:hypothetical protein
LLAEEIAEGDWVEIYHIGKIKIEIEASSGTLIAPDGKRYSVDHRLRTRVRLFQRFKEMCYAD